MLDALEPTPDPGWILGHQLVLRFGPDVLQIRVRAGENLCVEPRILGEFGMAEHAAALLELRVVADHQHDVLVGAGEHPRRHATIA